MFTLRSKRSGSPVRPNPSTTTEPSGNCVTRSASHAAGSDPAASRLVHRMRQLTGELSKRGKGGRTAMRSDSWGLQIGQRGRTIRRLMGHLRPGFPREGQGAAVRHRGQPEPRRAERRIARAATTARRLRKHGSGTVDSRRVPMAPRGSSPYTPALGCHRRTRGQRHPRGRRRNDRRRGLVVASG